MKFAINRIKDYHLVFVDLLHEIVVFERVQHVSRVLDEDLLVVFPVERLSVEAEEKQLVMLKHSAKAIAIPRAAC